MCACDYWSVLEPVLGFLNK